MREINLDRGWHFQAGQPDSGKLQRGIWGDRIVDLPHDFMIGYDTSPDAPAGAASGYYPGGLGVYTKAVEIPAEWEGERVLLRFDGAMMNATLEVNGSKVLLQHYGYAPFEADITSFVYFGEENRVTVALNAGIQPSSRWYSGAGLFRSVTLVHAPAVRAAFGGLYAYTEEIEYGEDGKAEAALLRLQAEIRNDTAEDQLAEVTFSLEKDGYGEELLSRRTTVQVPPMSSAEAYQRMTVYAPELWSAEEPALYRVCVSIRNTGTFRTRPVPARKETEDRDSVLFGIRTVRADARHGLRINGKSVKLRGGCIHHDNGMLGAASLYDAEYRKLSKMKAAGYNAVRTTHNPPSAALIEACDRLGMYVYDEAFDAWSTGKQAGDYNQYFDTDWEKDLTAFVKRDRSHPSVILWSTGNEIPERGGLANGYVLAAKLAETVRRLDGSRPVSNAVCSLWNGLDDRLMAESLAGHTEGMTGSIQNADLKGSEDPQWEALTEGFVNALDVVGYNYMERKYEMDHAIWPDRVILGSENFPKEIGLHWPMIEKTPYVIGDFTWTAWDYLGEAGIGKGLFLEKDDPLLEKGPWELLGMGSKYPWRTADDADFDITGRLLPQGVYRGIVWGSGKTAVFSYDPAVYGKKELLSAWGFPGVRESWTWAGQEGKPVTLAVFSAAQEVELFVNGRSIGVQTAGENQLDQMPMTFLFDTVYEPGTVEAVSRTDGQEVSRSCLRTAGEAAVLALVPETEKLKADIHSLAYVRAEIRDREGNPVPDAAEKLTASVEGVGTLAGFGSGDPQARENYTGGSFTTFRGQAAAVLRSAGRPGSITLTVTSEKYGKAVLTLPAG